MPDRKLAVIAQHSIPLFGGRRLDVRQARGVILALSGADVIREWQTLAASTPSTLSTLSTPSTSGHCYAGIALPEQAALSGHRLLVGCGTTPAGAIEDLLWQV